MLGGDCRLNAVSDGARLTVTVGSMRLTKSWVSIEGCGAKELASFAAQKLLVPERAT